MWYLMGRLHLGYLKHPAIHRGLLCSFLSTLIIYQAMCTTNSKLYHFIDSPTSALCLQVDIESAHMWSLDHGMELNTSKCKALKMSKKKKPTKQSYQLVGKILESANQTKSLGVLVTKDLSWETHLEHS